MRSPADGCVPHGVTGFVQSRKDYGVELDRIMPLARANKDAEARAIISGDGKKTALAEQADIRTMMALIVLSATRLPSLIGLLSRILAMRSVCSCT